MQQPPRTRSPSSVKQGVWEAGGVPLNLPVVSLGETQVRPTAMLWRNMAAMAIEEMLRANPIDGVVLLGGCDKTIPSLLMAAASVDLPAVVVPGGPMLTGTFRGVPLGCGTDVWRLSRGGPRRHAVRGRRSCDSESSMIRSRGPLQHDGHRVDDGPARRGARHDAARHGRDPGRRTAGCWPARTRPAGWSSRWSPRDRRPSQVLTAGSFHNAIVALAAIGGSTNAVVHLLAIAGRLGVPLTLDDFDRIGADVPLLVDLQPAGRFLMEDLHRAGGLPAVLREVVDLLDPDAIDRHRPAARRVTSATPQIWDREVIRAARRAAAAQRRHRRAARQPRARTARSSSRPRPRRTCCGTAAGRVVFDSIEDFHARIDDPDLDVDADSVLVLRGCGPQGYPGMPEVANMPLPTQAAASRACATWSGSATGG